MVASYTYRHGCNSALRFGLMTRFIDDALGIGGREPVNLATWLTGWLRVKRAVNEFVRGSLEVGRSEQDGSLGS